MGKDRPTTNNEEAMTEIGPDEPSQLSRQARIQQYYRELPDRKLKIAELVFYSQDVAISAAKAGGLGLLDNIENVAPDSSSLANVKGQ